MDDKQRRGIRARLRWTLGSMLMLVAATALDLALLRPLVAKAPPSLEPLGPFSLQGAPDGEWVYCLAPDAAWAKPAAGEAPSPKL